MLLKRLMELRHNSCSQSFRFIFFSCNYSYDFNEINFFFKFKQ